MKPIFLKKDHFDGVLSDMANELLQVETIDKNEFCSMFHYDVAMTFVYELVYYKIASKTFMINAMRNQMA